MDYSLYNFLFSRKKVHSIINKKSHIDIINKYIKIILKEAKGFVSIEKRNDLIYYIYFIIIHIYFMNIKS